MSGFAEKMIMKIIVSFIFVIALLGCGYDLVDKSENVVLSKKEYEELKVKADIAKQVGRYQIREEGTRTWRLDTATGEFCLLLATKYDWENSAKDQNVCH